MAEGHIDALRILRQAGHDPVPGSLYGVWASRSRGGGLSAIRELDRFRLSGTVPFASGSGLLDRALVTAVVQPQPGTGSVATEGEQLLLDVEVHDWLPDLDSWRTTAMAASRSFTVAVRDRSAAEDSRVGPAGFYLGRPGFFPGGIGVAAVWVGAAARVADLVSRFACGSPKGPDQAARLHLGRLRLELSTAQALVTRAGGQLATGADAPTSGWRVGDLQELATEVRAGVGSAVRRLLDTGRTLAGPAASPTTVSWAPPSPTSICMSGNNIPIATLNTWPGMVAELIVAIPAHNEQDSIAGCVAAVWRSIEIAVRAGQVSRALVTVSAHRCRDATAAFAETALARGPAVMPAVASAALRIDERSATVGAVRAGMISAAYQQLPAGSDSWLFNTDADSVVPPEWVVETLGHAQATGAVAVAGLVDVVGWRTTEAARRRYRQIIDQGMTSTGHRHVYGANLAVRLDAYLAVGGFSSVPRGEDTCLVNSLRAAGYQVASTFTPVVVTSGRVPGRAQQGLGALLGELTSSNPPATVAERLLRR